MATMIMPRGDAGKTPAPSAAAEKAALAAAAAVAPLEAEAKGKKLKAMLPLIVNLVAAPVLAYVVTQFVLVPKLAGNPAAAAKAPAEGAGAHGAEPAHAAEAKAAKPHGAKEESGAPAGKAKYAAPLSKKVLVNVAGTMGTRYLLAELTLVGPNAGIKEAVEKADAELRDAAAGTMSSKTITDLEKPGIRNLIRTELIAIFNSILGKGTVSEIYLTEFAIQ